MPAFTRHDAPKPILNAKSIQVILSTQRRDDDMVNVLRLLLAWTMNQGGWVKRNVTKRPGRLKVEPGYRKCTEANVAELMASVEAPIRRAVMVCTGQRKGDCQP